MIKKEIVLLILITCLSNVLSFGQEKEMPLIYRYKTIVTINDSELYKDSVVIVTIKRKARLKVGFDKISRCKGKIYTDVIFKDTLNNKNNFQIYRRNKRKINIKKYLTQNVNKVVITTHLTIKNKNIQNCNYCPFTFIINNTAKTQKQGKKRY